MKKKKKKRRSQTHDHPLCSPIDGESEIRIHGTFHLEELMVCNSTTQNYLLKIQTTRNKYSSHILYIECTQILVQYKFASTVKFDHMINNVTNNA